MSEKDLLGQPIPEEMHGSTTTAYTTYGCRCRVCRAAWAAYARDLRRRRAARPMPSSVQHGMANTYRNWGCRCDECRDAASTERRLERHARAERKRA